MRKRKVEREGDFIEVEIAQSVYTYCRLINSSSFIFYDFISTRPIDNVSDVAGVPFLINIGVMLYATRSWRWKIIDNIPFSPLEYLAISHVAEEARGVNSPMTSEHWLRKHFKVAGYDELNENFPWQRVHDENYDF